jgi:hypothetical protein
VTQLDAAVALTQEQSQYLYLIPPSSGFDVPLATALCKTFLLRMLNFS